MTKAVKEALRSWHRKRHGLFPRSFTPRVVVVLLLQQRLQRQAEQYAAQSAAQSRRVRRRLARQVQRHGAVLNGRLTREIWLGSIIPLLPRFGGTQR